MSVAVFSAIMYAITITINNNKNANNAVRDPGPSGTTPNPSPSNEVNKSLRLFSAINVTNKNNNV
jgi:hypothetical protein